MEEIEGGEARHPRPRRDVVWRRIPGNITLRLCKSVKEEEGRLH
jgi:hypothetical protein